jgi:tetratricopeptide (TPR) repeat protein
MDGDPSFDLKAACAAVDSGRKAASGAPAHERAYLDAVASWCPEYRPAEYIAAIKKVADAWPDDLDAQTLYAEALMIPSRWKWYGADGRPAEGMPECERALEEVLRRWPDHIGANHYYIHAVESSRTPERAVPSAQRLMGIAPWAGHLVHMPAHIWLVLGDYELAASLNERASAVDREYMTAANIPLGTYTPYYIHNMHFIVYARWMQGHRAQALQAADAMAIAAGSMAEMIPELADAFLAQTVFARARTLAWDDVLRMKQPGEKMAATNVIWRYARVLALLAKGDRAGAAREREAFEEARKKIPSDAPWGQNKAGDVLALAAEVVAARMGEDPIAHWEKAVAIQDGFVYDEPPAWYYPVRESLGAELVRSGRAAEGEKVLREGLRRSPRNGFMLFGLMEALKAQGKDSEEVRREFEAVWAKSDITLTLASL